MNCYYIKLTDLYSFTGFIPCKYCKVWRWMDPQPIPTNDGDNKWAAM